MNSRLYAVNAGVETSTQPDAGTPTDPADLVTLDYLESNVVTTEGIRSYFVALADGDLSKSVVYNTPLANNNYVLNVAIKNTTDADPDISPVVITAQATTGFTVKFNRINGANHILVYSTTPYSNP
jgi:hypothetical protein